MTTLKLHVSNLSGSELAYNNFVYVSPANYQALLKNNCIEELIYTLIKNYIFIVSCDSSLSNNNIALGRFHREYMQLSYIDVLHISVFQPSKNELKTVTIEVDHFTYKESNKNDNNINIDEDELNNNIKSALMDQYIQKSQIFPVKYQNKYTLKVKIINIETNDENITTGKFVLSTHININNKLNLKSTATNGNLFTDGFKFENLNVGGLDKQLSDIFKQAFLTRRVAPSEINKFGTEHAKGVLLYGPPGTGKTLIARELAKVLRAKEPKIVNGPELFDKFVGESERKIRDLFADAINDQKKYGASSDLHVIIFDEFDAIAKKRGGSGTLSSVTDSCINMLLTMMDGVNSLNNILVIGMTNRKDIIDPAILRPGRFDIHVEIGLPDNDGRIKILEIHTKKMRENHKLASTVDLKMIAEQTINYTGAEIANVVRRAVGHSFSRSDDIMNFDKNACIDNTMVEYCDFVQAITEIKPQFGCDVIKFHKFLRHKMIKYNSSYKEAIHALTIAINQIKLIPLTGQTHKRTILIDGLRGVGKTALAAKIALESNIPFIRFISAEDLVNLDDTEKKLHIIKIFEDAYLSKEALIILDDIERIIEYINIGPRFCMTVLQTLLVLINKISSNNKILIIGTTSNKELLENLEIAQLFDTTIKLYPLTHDHIEEVLCELNETNYLKINPIELEHIVGFMRIALKNDIPIGKLMMIIDSMINDLEYKDNLVTYEIFLEYYYNYFNVGIKRGEDVLRRII